MTLLSLLLFVLALVPFVVTVRNLFHFRSPPTRGRIRPGEKISVLIPARNEAGRIEHCLRSVLANTEVPLEVWVFDDESEDATAEQVSQIARHDKRLRLLRSPGLPKGWNGKQFGCHCLALAAQNPLLLFIDADVRLSPDALFRSVLQKRQTNAGLISAVPHQKTVTLGERCFLPLLHFLLLGFLPLWRMRRSLHPSYAAGCGQFMLVDKATYDRVGGHTTIAQSLHDGLKLPRAFRQAGYATDIVDGTTIASCRMYSKTTDLLNGMMKNATEGFARFGVLPWMTLLLGGGQLLPWIFMIGGWPALSRPAGIALASAIIVTLVQRFLLALRFRQDWIGPFLHPVAITGFLAVQWWACWRQLVQRKGPTWKGRTKPLVNKKRKEDMTLRSLVIAGLLGAIAFSPAQAEKETAPNLSSKIKKRPEVGALKCNGMSDPLLVRPRRIEKALQKSLPKTVAQSKSFKKTPHGLKFVATAGKISVTIRDAKLHITMPVSFSAQHAKNTPLGFIKLGSCSGRVELLMKTALSIGKEGQLIVKTCPAGRNWTDRCKVTVFNVDITNRVDAKVAPHHEKAAEKIDQRLRELLDIKPRHTD